MANPNSWLTRLRRELARMIQPGPAGGEAWCVDCDLNDGRTLIVSADGFRDHARRHREELPDSHVSMQVAWPVTAEEAPGGWSAMAAGTEPGAPAPLMTAAAMQMARDELWRSPPLLAADCEHDLLCLLVIEVRQTVVCRKCGGLDAGASRRVITEPGTWVIGEAAAPVRLLESGLRVMYEENRGA